MSRIRKSNQLLDEAKLRELVRQALPERQISEPWLQSQRIKLVAALEVLEVRAARHPIRTTIASLINSLSDVLIPYTPALAGAAALVLGIFIGRLTIPARLPEEAGSTPIAEKAIDLKELISSGQLRDIDILTTGDPENPVEIDLTTGQQLKLTGSLDREDILTALEYVLVKDPNPGQRLHSARILSQVDLNDNQSTTMVLVAAMLSDENPGIRLSIARSLKGVNSPIVKEALIKLLLEDEHEGVRIAAIENLEFFINDTDVQSALLLVSRIDPLENVRYQAYKVLSGVVEMSTENRLDSAQ